MTFTDRVRSVRPLRWLRFGIVALIYLLWVAWMGCWWLALGLILLFDIYITGYIPFTFWKKSRSAVVRTVMSWIDAIVYALILVYFVFAFIGQNYQIPSSSLEHTLLTGDYLWVNKFVYGPRVPMTPVHFPLAHNTMPLIGGDSYLDNPSVSYKRLKGLRNVEAGDIVVFNFPAGDTVCTLKEDSPEYYEYLVRKVGRQTIVNNPREYGEIKYRPVDRRTNFVKRAVGLPGQNFRIVADTIYIDGQPQAMPENAQFNYLVALTRPMDEDLAKKYGLNPLDVNGIGPADREQAAAIFGDMAQGASAFYVMAVSIPVMKKMEDDGLLKAYVKFNDLTSTAFVPENDYLFPYGVAGRWTLSDYGGERGITIPAKGMTVELTPENWLTYERCIRNYENHPEAYYDFDQNQAYIGGKPAATYTFGMDYYFMMGDNRDRSQDSRFWGFVPEDHIVGTPIIVLASFDPNRSLFDGKIRWDRILRDANPDK